MLRLPDITLIALTGKDFYAHDMAIARSIKGVEFGAVKVVYDYGIKDINEWNRKIIYELHRYVDTDYALLIHADGYVVNPKAWRNEFYEYDYIGAPWPLPTDNYSYRTPDGEVVRVGNSVSLRSKNILELPSKLKLEWKSYYGNTNEDGFLCCHNRRILEENGCRFAPLEVAKYFSKEHEIPENRGLETFAFHSVDL
jgi:hypothetical protein